MYQPYRKKAQHLPKKFKSLLKNLNPSRKNLNPPEKFPTPPEKISTLQKISQPLPKKSQPSRKIPNPSRKNLNRPSQKKLNFPEISPPPQNLTQVVASILVTSVTPPPPIEFCRVWRPCIEQSYISTARSQHRQGVLLYLPIMSN